MLSRGVFSASGIASMWCGMLVAIALSATVKFTAPTLTRAVGLDVGRHVFHAFGIVELALWSLLAWALWMSSRGHYPLLVGLGLCVAAQALWLRPSLAARAVAIIAHGPDAVGPSATHLYYVVLDGIKLGLLVAIAHVSSR